MWNIYFCILETAVVYVRSIVYRFTVKKNIVYYRVQYQCILPNEAPNAADQEHLVLRKSVNKENSFTCAYVGFRKRGAAKGIAEIGLIFTELFTPNYRSSTPNYYQLS